jgi:hypothetical protein
MPFAREASGCEDLLRPNNICRSEPRNSVSPLGLCPSIPCGFIFDLSLNFGHDIFRIDQPDLMKITPTPLPGVMLLEPKVFADERSFFLESYNEKVMADLGIQERFVQDNQFVLPPKRSPRVALSAVPSSGEPWCG